MTSPPFAETDATIRQWAEAEFAAWQYHNLDSSRAESLIREAALQDGGICLIRISNGSVALDPEVVAAWPDLADPSTPMGYRARYYLAHFRDAFAAYGMNGSGLVGIYLHDLYPDAFDAPIFCFQKRQGSRSLLLPDIDFLSWQYYCDEQNRYVDDKSFSAKKADAIFVGSTTGDVVLTAQHVRSLSNARLRAAVYFRGHERVIFHLPHVVQCDDAETEALVSGLGVAGRRWSWKEQLDYQYLISLDGNGATCSRVALGLASNSVLLKYESPYHLYYFRGLEAWTHYIPILAERDVEGVLQNGAQWIEGGTRMAEASKTFSARFLKRPSVLRYTAELVALYLAKFGAPSEPLCNRGYDHLVDVFAHLAVHGSQWGASGTWLAGDRATTIEGICLTALEDIPSEDLSYSVVSSDGIVTAAQGGEFCGSYGMGRSLHGLSIALRGPSAKRFRLSYRLRFADGFECEQADTADAQWRRAALIDLRLKIYPRRPLFRNPFGAATRRNKQQRCTR